MLNVRNIITTFANSVKSFIRKYVLKTENFLTDVIPVRNEIRSWIGRLTNWVTKTYKRTSSSRTKLM